LNAKALGASVWLVLVWAVAGVSPAGAAPIDCIDPIDPEVICAATRPVTGTDLAQFSFEVTEAGFFEVLLIDLSTLNPQIAGPLELNLQVVQPPGVLTPLITTDNGAQAYFFQPNTYFAQVYAVLASNAQSTIEGLATGMYGLSVRAVEVIPLPASALLLLSALIGLSARMRRRVRQH